MSTLALPGRGTSQTPPNRYETLHVELDAEARPENARALAESGRAFDDALEEAIHVGTQRARTLHLGGTRARVCAR